MRRRPTPREPIASPSLVQVARRWPRSIVRSSTSSQWAIIARSSRPTRTYVLSAARRPDNQPAGGTASGQPALLARVQWHVLPALPARRGAHVGNPQPALRTADGPLGGLPRLLVVAGGGERLLGLAQVVGRAGAVDRLGRLGVLDQHEHLVVLDGEVPLGGGVGPHLVVQQPDPGLADAQVGDQRGVAGEDAHLALHARRDDHRRVALVDRPLRGEHADRDALALLGAEAGAHAAAISDACSSASSMPPTMKNAPSGTSSCRPSTISLNPRTVSPTGTYLPGRPVKASATWKGCERKRSILRARDTVSFCSSVSSSTPRIAMMSWRSL